MMGGEKRSLAITKAVYWVRGHFFAKELQNHFQATVLFLHAKNDAVHNRHRAG